MRVAVVLSSVLAPDVESDIAAGRRPRIEHLEFCRATGAKLIRLDQRRPRWLRRLRPRHQLVSFWSAVEALRATRGYDVVITDSEHVGLPFAALLWLTRSRCRHIAIVHRVSTRAKQLIIRTVATRGTACFVHHFETCAGVLESAGVPPDRRRLIPYMVDTRFWSPQRYVEPERQICAVGLEFRDYPTLFRAVRNLDVHVEVAAGSPWSQMPDSSANEQPPPNVHVGKRPYGELRELYARSLLTVVPLKENDMQAGITTIVESMAMGRPVVASATKGQTGTVRDGLNGANVVPGDVDDLRARLLQLLDDPQESRRLGENARRFVEERMTIERFVQRMSALVTEVASAAPVTPAPSVDAQSKAVPE